jgi:hypothetical protein
VPRRDVPGPDGPGQLPPYVRPRRLGCVCACTCLLTAGRGCAECPPNTWSDAGSSTCTPCSVGSTAASGSAACTCLAGYYGDGGVSRTVPCTSTSIAWSRHGTVLTRYAAVCASHTYSSSPGSSVCLPCPAGYATAGPGAQGAAACVGRCRSLSVRVFRGRLTGAGCIPACSAGSFTTGTGDGCTCTWREM